MDLYRLRRRREREARFLEQLRLNRAAWLASSQIEDLKNPSCYRYLFDLPPERANRSRFASDVT